MLSVLAKDSKKEKRVRKLNKKKYMSILRTILTWNICYKKESYINHMTNYTPFASAETQYIFSIQGMCLYMLYFSR